MTKAKDRLYAYLLYRFDLRGRLMLLAMVPVIIFAFAWGIYVVQQRATDLTAQLTQRAELLARQMAIAADYGIFSRNVSALQSLTLAVSREPSVLAASIYTADHEILATHRSQTHLPQMQLSQVNALFERSQRLGYQSVNTRQGNWLAYLEPVRSPSLIVDDLLEAVPGSAQTRNRGYAVVEVSADETRTELLKFGATVAVLLASVLFAGWLMARNFSTRIDLRFKEIAQAAQGIGAGKTGVRLKRAEIPVFDRLSQDLNSMAEQLELSRQGLEKRVDEVTVALREQRDAAQHANTAKTRFLAAASHDLRQPMHALSLLVAALKQEQLPAQREDLLNRIDATTEAMSNLLDALLDISRLDAGGVQSRIETFEIQPLLTRLQSTYEPLADRKHVELIVLSSRACVQSDPMLLERMLGNFLSNAIRYTQPGGRVLVAVRQRPDGCVLQVRDNGPGIEAIHQPAIFQEFVQIHNPQRDRSQGLGLGLAIVRRLSQLLAHPVELRSCPGHGSTFAVCVPFGSAPTIPSALDSVADTPHQLAVPTADSDELQGCRILLVEDDALVRESYQRLLQLWGCQVSMHADGESALAQLRQAVDKPELIISDHRLGEGVNGLELIALARAILGQPTPSILITGDTEEPSLRNLDESVIRVLFKPVRPSALGQALKRLRHAWVQSQSSVE